MAPKASSGTPKKKPAGSPPKKGKLAVKADYGGVFFGSKEPATSRDEGGAEEVEEDPLATYRAAAAAAARAAEKERKEEARLQLFRKIFAAMDADHDGKVEMADMVERVAAGTAQLSHRAQARRPEGAVALQLPMVFSLDDWLKEMKRMSAEMDEETFQANVLGLFECFTDAPAAAPVVLGPVPSRAPAAGAPAAGAPAPTHASPSTAERDALLRELFDAMDADADGAIRLDDFLLQARSSAEAGELRGLFHFFDAHFGGQDEALGFAAFREGTLARTPLGRMRDAPFASAVRGMLSDVRHARALTAAAEKRTALLRTLFETLDVREAGALDLDAFTATAKSRAEADELRATFADFDSAGGAVPDGALTFRKFATGTMTATPLGKMREAQFERAVGGMIEDAKKATAAKQPAAEGASVDVS